jgi:hypothetical protein
LTGLTKRIKITKKIESTTHPNKFKMEEKILEIKIRPGWKEGTRVTFENVRMNLIMIIKQLVCNLLDDRSKILNRYISSAKSSATVAW